MTATGKPIVKLDRVSKRFGDVNAVDGISLEVPPGQIFGMIGPSSRGKTTLIRLLVGVLAPSGGHVSVFGHERRRA
jgi:ABC-2 type transport system ATP-binding protein